MRRPHEGHTLGQSPAADAGLSLLEVGKVALASSGADVIVATTVTNRYCYYFFLSPLSEFDDCEYAMLHSFLRSKQ